MTPSETRRAVDRMVIRRALPGDAGALTRIAQAAKAHWGYPDELLALWRPALTVTEDFVLRWPAYVAMIEGTPVGFYAVTGADETRELEHLWVLPEWMLLGVGSALLRHASRTVLADGGMRLRIASDPNAEAFYLDRGARRVGDVPSTPTGRTLPLLVLEIA